MPAGPDSASARSSERFGELTAKSSEIVRSLSLAAIALIWLFSGGLSIGTTSQDTLHALRDERLLFATMLLAVATVALDLWQYTTSALRWGLYHWALDQALSNDTKPDMGWRGRVGWRLLRHFSALRNVEVRTTSTLIAQSKPQKYALRRDRMRNALAGRSPFSDEAAAKVRASLDSFIPSSLPRLATIFFVLKVLAASATYVLLGIYLLTA